VDSLIARNDGKGVELASVKKVTALSVIKELLKWGEGGLSSWFFWSRPGGGKERGIRERGFLHDHLSEKGETQGRKSCLFSASVVGSSWAGGVQRFGGVR